MAGQRQIKGATTGSGADDLTVTIVKGSLVVLVMLGFASGIILPLVAGGLKLAAGDYPPGAILFLFTGFVLCVLTGWIVKRYRDQLVVLGVSMLTILGVIWAIFEDGYGPKAFMVSLVVTAGFMAALGFYNVFLKKRQTRSMG